MTTHDLLTVLRWSAPPNPVDWNEVESAVGRTYPAEFKQIADALPPGSFQTFLSLLHPAQFDRPGEYVEEVRGYADQLRGDAADNEVQPPSFVGFDGSAAPALAGPEPDYWAGPAERRPMIGPADAVNDLRGVVESTPVPPVDWDLVPSRLGFYLPADFRHLVDELGRVRVGPVTVNIPGGRPDFFRSYNALRKRVAKLRATGEGPRGTIYPEPRGALKWAELAGGGSVCWLSTSARPEQWAVLVLDAEMKFAETYPMTASRFLLELATNPQNVLLPPPA